MSKQVRYSTEDAAHFHGKILCLFNDSWDDVKYTIKNGMIECNGWFSVEHRAQSIVLIAHQRSVIQHFDLDVDDVFTFPTNCTQLKLGPHVDVTGDIPHIKECVVHEWCTIDVNFSNLLILSVHAKSSGSTVNIRAPELANVNAHGNAKVNYTGAWQGKNSLSVHTTEDAVVSFGNTAINGIFTCVARDSSTVENVCLVARSHVRVEKKSTFRYKGIAPYVDLSQGGNVFKLENSEEPLNLNFT